MWIYSQGLGNLYQRSSDVGDANLIGKGYSGKDAGLNNPTMQCMQDIGPIPRGDYTIGAPVDGPTAYSLPLTPDPTNDMCDPTRTSFYIHGDRNEPALPFQASDGCIVLNRTIRQNIWAAVSTSGDTTLRVIDYAP